MGALFFWGILGGMENRDTATELNGYEGCRQCGNCCNIRIVAITLEEVERIREYIDENGVVARDNGPFTCPLLDEDNRCMVWPVRSQTCRLHSCERTRNAILAEHPEVEREADRHWLDMRGAWLHGDFRDAREIDYFGEGLIDDEMQKYIDSL